MSADSSYKQRSDYIYASTRVWGYEKRLLSGESWSRLRGAADFAEALQILRESSYGQNVSEEREEGLAYSALLEKEAARLQRDLSEAAPGSPLLRLLELDDVYHDLKVLVKKILLQIEGDALLRPVDAVDLRWAENLLRYPENNLREEPYEKVLGEVTDDFAQNADPERAEFLLDAGLYAEKLSLAAQLDAPLIRQWAEEQLDFQNLLTFLRARRTRRSAEQLTLALIPGGHLQPRALLEMAGEKELPTESALREAGAPAAVIQAYLGFLARPENLAALEKARDERSLDLAREALRTSYGPEVLFGYALLRRAEIQNLRILLVGLKNNMSKERREAPLRGAFAGA